MLRQCHMRASHCWQQFVTLSLRRRRRRRNNSDAARRLKIAQARNRKIKHKTRACKLLRNVSSVFQRPQTQRNATSTLSRIAQRDFQSQSQILEEEKKKKSVEVQLGGFRLSCSIMSAASRRSLQLLLVVAWLAASSRANFAQAHLQEQQSNQQQPQQQVEEAVSTKTRLQQLVKLISDTQSSDAELAKAEQDAISAASEGNNDKFERTRAKLDLKVLFNRRLINSLNLARYGVALRELAGGPNEAAEARKMDSRLSAPQQQHMIDA